jgi:uncharacterized protein YqfA (UPF0365 family)
MPFKRAAAIDLAGRDMLAAVKMSVIPKVIETPRIAAVAKSLSNNSSSFQHNVSTGKLE